MNRLILSITLIIGLCLSIVSKAELKTASELACQIEVSYLEDTRDKFVIPVGNQNLVKSFDVLSSSRQEQGGYIDMNAYSDGTIIHYSVELRNMNYLRVVGGSGYAPAGYEIPLPGTLIDSSSLPLSFIGEEGRRIRCELR